MKNTFVSLGICSALALTCTVANAEMYKVHVKRTDSNLYIDRTNKILIKTKYCYEYTYGEVIPPFLIELMGRKSKALLLFKNRWTTIY